MHSRERGPTDLSGRRADTVRPSRSAPAWVRSGEGALRCAAVVAQGNADFRFGALGRDRAALDTLAEEIWTRELPHGLRWRAAHAAAAMGFLGPNPETSTDPARVAAHNRWLRLDTPYGTVLERGVLEGSLRA